MFCLIAVCSNIKAQKILNNSLSFLDGEKNIATEIDYSKMMIQGMTLQDFLLSKLPTQEERDKWSTKAEKDIYNRFIIAFNSALIKCGLNFRSDISQPYNYRATIEIMEADKHGNLNVKIPFTDVTTNKMMACIELYGKGGKYGTTSNLLGDGIESVARRLAKCIVEILSKNKE